MKRFIMLLAMALVATTSVCSAQGGLNAIRFRDWSDEQWYDNEYIREVRRYVDAVAREQIKDEVLEPYRDIIDSKFCVGEVECSLWGGADIFIMFLDDTSKVFSVHVYSSVDEQTEEVFDYEVRRVSLVDDACPFTREYLLQFVKDNPIHKLW